MVGLVDRQLDSCGLAVRLVPAAFSRSGRPSHAMELSIEVAGAAWSLSGIPAIADRKPSFAG